MRVSSKCTRTVSGASGIPLTTRMSCLLSLAANPISRSYLAAEALCGRRVSTLMFMKLVSKTVMAMLYSLTYAMVGVITLNRWKHILLL